MASYPNAVKSFTTKNPGDRIQSVDIDDVQDEISAIEGGLINGTAHLHSSNSTMANLSVPGASTFAGAVTFVLPPPSVRVRSTISQNVASGVATPVTFETEDWMTAAGMHSTAANTTKLKPSSTGIYALSGGVSWSQSTGSYRQLTIALDGSSNIAFVVQTHTDTSGLAQIVATQAYFRSTVQYAELVVAQGLGSTVSIAAAHFEMTRLR